MRRMVLLVVLAGLAAASAAATAKAEEFSYVDLVRRLTDLERLATLPAPGDTCAQWSSYDRRSAYDAAAGTYVAWEANGDGTGSMRTEGDRIVMAEMEGPGCIWRIWSARAEQGHVQIYLDGSDEPAVDLPFAGYFNRDHKPFVYPSLVHTTGRGLNNYVPIPYQKSCRIVADKGWGRYFHFVYETFPKGTRVPTFSRDLAPDAVEALKKSDIFMTQWLGTDPAGERPGQETLTTTAIVAGGASALVADLKGPRAITAIRVVNDLGDPADTVVPALRELAIRITWDGADQAAVWAPLADFFGTAPGVNLYRSLPLGMTEQEFYALWYMPFAESARVELVNDGKATRKVTFRITHAPLARPIETLGRFHAKWHRDAFLPKEPERKIDWTLLATRGRGRFCGVMLHVWNPRGKWWGEGDEKFYVDGEKFPSTFGTGSEDYFGYAWCTPEIFHNAYHNQTIASGNRGHISVNRWHIADDIPFQTGFEGAIEKYFPNDRPTLYAAIAYWYLAPGGEDPYGPVPVAERVDYYEAAEAIQATKVQGALEGETLKVLSKTAGQLRRQAMTGYGSTWSGEEQLWWTGAKPGDRLVLEVPAPKAGAYKLTVNLTKAIDYGIVQLSLDGKKLGEPVDLFNNGVVPTGPIALGTHTLEAGPHRLTVEIVGTNPKAKPAYMFGLDYVKLEPAE